MTKTKLKQIQVSNFGDTNIRQTKTKLRLKNKKRAEGEQKRMMSTTNLNNIRFQYFTRGNLVEEFLQSGTDKVEPVICQQR